MGCFVATGVADIAAEKIRQISFLQAHSRPRFLFLPQHPD
jgi:hypothetical protein